MKQTIIKALKPAFLVSIVLLIICGIIYPLLLTGIGQLTMNHQANGSLIEINGKKVGSEIVGQQFTDARFLKGRISAYNYNTYTEKDLRPDESGEAAYNGVASGSSNYSSTNPELQARVTESMDKFLAANPGVKKEDIPTDLMTSSGSGLDPHLSPASAEIQIPAMAKASGLSEDELRSIVADNTEGKFLKVFGEKRVNVLKTNIAIAQKLGII
ncbi:MAG: K(+)-transporting ATPase subunit C [Eubacterium sp.]